MKLKDGRHRRAEVREELWREPSKELAFRRGFVGVSVDEKKSFDGFI